MIAISKIEEFAAILDDSIDTTALERVPFEQRIPVGMYAFSYLEENNLILLLLINFSQEIDNLLFCAILQLSIYKLHSAH